MSDQKPTMLDTDKTGNLAVTMIQMLFEKQGWVFRRADGSFDFGVDSEVEITDNNQVTGKVFKCQIKGTKGLLFENGYETVQVKTTTWNNWKSLSLPVVALLCDVDSELIYWCLPLGFEPKPDKDTVTLKFSKENCINSKFSEFKAIVRTWLDAFPKPNILREVPFYFELFTETLEPVIDWGDAWSDAEEYNMSSRVFYSHVLELRSSLGLRNDEIFPFEFWLIRNQGMYDDPLVLFHGTLSEMLFYIKSFYQEALDKLAARLKKVKDCFENNEILNFFELEPFLRKNTGGTSVTCHPWGDYAKFHTAVEATLESKGYRLKAKWMPRKNS